MLAKILFIFSALFVQEWVLLNTLILATHHGLYSPVLIFILFSIASAIDIVVGFYIGKYLKRKTSRTKVGGYIQKISHRFSQALNNPRRWFVMLILGNFSFCYINAAVMAYLDLPFWESSAYNFFGNILSYILVWYAVGGISSLFKNIYIAGGVVIGLSLTILFLLRKVKIERI
jgi:hypothetical protein